ncbi:MAG TPA: carboxypeptidase-like regulatory domain-containing protein [Terriglobia bacterium]|nr:carboxypeptidase-like regulatory domain-containing protein [Terriglobia bacterium]
MKMVLTAFVLILMISGIAHAQLGDLGCRSQAVGSTLFTLHGTIIIPVRDHAEIFEVFLLSNNGEQILARTIADSNGRYCFLDIPRDRYDFVVRLEGFKELREGIHIGDPPPPPSMKGVYEMIFWLSPVDTVVVVDERLRG